MGTLFINIHETVHKLYVLFLCVMNENTIFKEYLAGQKQARCSWASRARGAAALPGVDLQRGLQDLSALLLGLGQLLHAQEVPGGPHLQHSDHGRVGV